MKYRRKPICMKTVVFALEKCKGAAFFQEIADAYDEIFEGVDYIQLQYILDKLAERGDIEKLTDDGIDKRGGYYYYEFYRIKERGA